MRITDFNEETVEELKKSYRIGFINSEGKEDETELDASDIYDLAEAYAVFCADNNLTMDTVTYIEAVEQTEKPDHVYVPYQCRGQFDPESGFFYGQGKRQKSDERGL